MTSPGVTSPDTRPADVSGAAEDLLVEVRDLSVAFPADGDGDSAVRAVDGLSFTLAPGRALGIVGESGSGKSTVAAALLDLHRGTGAWVGGTVRVAGTDVRAADERALRRLRGGRAAMVFQDPLSSLDPYYAIGDQIAEVYRVHRPDVSRRAARARAVEVLERVGIADAPRRARSRPHEFSGGMRQRALLAMALACEPRLLIADEPTTALDVTVQAQILDLLHDLRAETGMGLLLVTHDLGVVAGSVDEVLVMRGGRAVEHGTVGEVLRTPREPYTKELLAAVPRVDAEPAVRRARASGGEDGVLLEAAGLRREFGGRRNRTTAVDEVSLTVREGEVLGLVGESGSGKTTLGRMLVRLLDPTAGTLRYRGHDIGALTDRKLRPLRSELQMVFQDPVSSLNPRRSIGESVADPLRAAGDRDDARVVRRACELLERVGLDPAWYHRYPHEFSGGQRQRVGIARALAPGPRLLVCDEPVSALDVTTQAQIMELLGELRRELGLALVFIAHDLAVVRAVSDRVAVMRGGRIVEEGPTGEVYGRPAHPYTKGLLAAVPVLDPDVSAGRRALRAAA
ncbi:MULTISPECIES: dipeptide ABC transporter ATP-binding protein [Streptomyces]|uniref:ABC transporter ATP-binding protein n=2 Tax=Streptomyces rimosus subsp. rimosus TaxID=132474 RepID=L8EII7_STRR1|nr:MULTISPECIES: ABC transporter ATP-binding protein [Streptomyces]KOG79102.1 ABC transporter ATP-binding protein [Kitasatospora aureofaciens]MYT45994.1 dipeptide ABC transporter ATP-binding protein [Streptomyces sp. SID5471]KEF04390.1 ABC transporter ATP-binding protein [Streptomyces rimosus]KOT40905.1 ABC transporter ATP-binding protein [Streptomyces rimosus subsp. rimosus]KOT40997.1 ABC transporter ATP-binding protein [Streptomyces sp. NRRL WC-3701]